MWMAGLRLLKCLQGGVVGIALLSFASFGDDLRQTLPLEKGHKIRNGFRFQGWFMAFLCRR